MNNYDDLLREKEKHDQFDDSSMDKHWAAIETQLDAPVQNPASKYRKLFLGVTAAAAVLLIIFFAYTVYNKAPQKTKETVVAITKSAILPPLKGLNVPYEIFSFDAATGDTLFTLNGSIIIFPKNAVLNSKGETVTGNIEIHTREFNDPFDYSIAGIPMDYDSAGVKYQFISSAMIDINAYQNGEILQVNPAAKPQLNLVSTNKERKTNLYKLDTVSGKWINRGVDEVNMVGLKETGSYMMDRIFRTGDSILANDEGSADATDFFDETIPKKMPAPPQKASNLNPVINVMIDPASFKELLVYDGLKFEVTDAKADKVGEDSKVDWDNIELVRGEISGTYKVVFSAGTKKVTYTVKPVLEGKDFVAAEKLYQQKLKEYNQIQNDRKKDEDKQKLLVQQNLNDRRVMDIAVQEREEDNRRTEELNKLIAIRNKYIEAENIKIMAINIENKMRRDSTIKANNELADRQKKEFEKQMADAAKQQAIWEQNNRTAALDQNLIRSFQIDGFGYWNCDQPSLPPTQPYIVGFKITKNGFLRYNTLCMATAGINRIENYGYTNPLKLINNASYFGWAFNASQFYYFSQADFKNAVRVNNTITISMNLYEGDAKNYSELKAYIFKVNSDNDISKK